jgi:hypothetical protein
VYSLGAGVVQVRPGRPHNIVTGSCRAAQIINESILTPLLGFRRSSPQKIAKPNLNDSCRCSQSRLSEPTMVFFLPRGESAVWTVCNCLNKKKTTFLGVLKNRGKNRFQFTRCHAYYLLYCAELA